MATIQSFVLADVRRYIQKWTERQYVCGIIWDLTVKPESVLVDCDEKKTT